MAHPSLPGPLLQPYASWWPRSEEFYWAPAGKIPNPQAWAPILNAPRNVWGDVPGTPAYPNPGLNPGVPRPPVYAREDAQMGELFWQESGAVDAGQPTEAEARAAWAVIGDELGLAIDPATGVPATTPQNMAIASHWAYCADRVSLDQFAMILLALYTRVGGNLITFRNSLRDFVQGATAQCGPPPLQEMELPPVGIPPEPGLREVPGGVAVDLPSGHTIQTTVGPAEKKAADVPWGWIALGVGLVVVVGAGVYFSTKPKRRRNPRRRARRRARARRRRNPKAGRRRRAARARAR